MRLFPPYHCINATVPVAGTMLKVPRGDQGFCLDNSQKEFKWGP